MYNAYWCAFFLINVRQGCSGELANSNCKCVLWHFADNFNRLNGRKPVLQMKTWF
jgi:hypothetical protein